MYLSPRRSMEHVCVYVCVYVCVCACMSERRKKKSRLSPRGHVRSLDTPYTHIHKKAYTPRGRSAGWFVYNSVLVRFCQPHWNGSWDFGIAGSHDLLRFRRVCRHLFVWSRKNNPTHTTTSGSLGPLGVRHSDGWCMLLRAIRISSMRNCRVRVCMYTTNQSFV